MWARTAATWPGGASSSARDPLLRRLLAFADIVAALLASASMLFSGDGGIAQFGWSLLYLPVWVVVVKLLGLYDRDGRVFRHLTVDEVPELVLWALIGTSGLAFFLGLTSAARPDASSAVITGLVAVAAVLILRASARWLWRTVTPPERVAIIGTIASATTVRRKLELLPDVHMTIVAVHDVVDIVGISRDLDWSATVDRLVVVPSSLDEHEVLALLEFARSTGLKLTLVPPCHGVFGTGVQLSHLAELPLLEYQTGNLSRSTIFLKRVLDIAVSAALLPVFLPLLAAITVAIKLDGRGPVLFVQPRAGIDGRPFKMLKFRSMVVDAEELLQDLVPFGALSEPVFKLPNDPRVTRVGRFLRRWSLDELPQLVNVLKGDMGLVGPRPEQLDLVECYSLDQRFRLKVKPGLTGPMQVYGRGRLTLSERLALERDYIENLSIGRDLRIIAMTLAVVLGRRGAY
jgi:exopolysaccharide biosynthesis polyprenyl glycosylphosphotransferase